MPAVTARVQTPLNLILPLKDGHAQLLGQKLMELDTQPGGSAVSRALARLGNVHFAQFTFLDARHLAVLTIFDGDFDEYLLSFVEHIGAIFDEILAHVDGAPPLPVRANQQAFLDFIHAHNVKGLGLFSAYPNTRVFDIKDALGVS